MVDAGQGKIGLRADTERFLITVLEAMSYSLTNAH
jgi:hypothetical protein